MKKHINRKAWEIEINTDHIKNNTKLLKDQRIWTKQIFVGFLKQFFWIRVEFSELKIMNFLLQFSKAVCICV